MSEWIFQQPCVSPSEIELTTVCEQRITFLSKTVYDTASTIHSKVRKSVKESYNAVVYTEIQID